MNQYGWRYIEDGRIVGGPKALPDNWRDKGDISGWDAKALKAEGWLPNIVDDQRKPGEVDAGWSDVLEADRVVQTLRSQPAPPPDPEQVRQQAIDNAIASDATLSAIKAMTNAEYDTWWSANVTNATQAIAVLKRVVRVLVRRVL